MCILVVKQKGVKFPSLQNIQNCMDNNPDGFSMAWVENGTVLNYRTLDSKDFIKKYKEVSKLDFKKTPAIFHMRIKTHGTVKLDNTHCWIKNGIAFAHNGILSVKNKGDMTDSETFFEDIFMPIYMAYGWDKAINAINCVIGTSKFAFLQPNGNIKAFGNFIESQGVLYSNSTYTKVARYNYRSRCSDWDYDSWDDYYIRRPYVYDFEKKEYVYRTSKMSDKEWDEMVNKYNKELEARWAKTGK